MANNPVIDKDGTKAWYRDGKFHREDGPAIIEPDGYQAWWDNGVEYSFDDWAKELNLSQEQIIKLKIKYNAL